MRSTLLALALLLALAAPAGAAVAFDANFASDTNPSSAGTFSFVSNAGNQVTGTVGASATVLIGYAYFDGDNVAVGTVTMHWDSAGSNQSMTQIACANVAGGYSLCMFGLKSPVSGAKTIKVDWTSASSQAMALGAISFTGSDTAGTGWSNNGSDTGTVSPSSSTVTTTAGGMAVVGSLVGGASNMTIQNGTTAWIDNNSAPNNIGYSLAAAYRVDQALSTVVSWTLSAAANWTNLKVNVPAAAAGGACQRTLVGVGC